MTGLVSQVARTSGSDAPTPEGRRKAGVGLLVVLALVVLAVVTDNVIYVVGFLVFTLGLLVSVVLHEAGHFLTARAYGMKATQFFVGFGPTLFSRRRGETEYGVKAVPAGGFVKIVGMTPLEDVDPEDEHRAFYRSTTGRKVVVLAAGSFVHFVIAALLVVGSVFVLGVASEREPAVGAVAQCVADSTADTPPDADPCTGPGTAEAPALAAGLQPGDVITAVDGAPVRSNADLRDALQPRAGERVVLSVERGGERREVPVTPAAVSRVVDEDGTVERVGTIGIGVQTRFGTERPDSLGDGLSESAEIGRQFAEGIQRTFTEKLGSITTLYSDDRDPEGFIGVVGAGRISGEILESEETGTFKALNMVLIVASLNLFVGLFNLLPLLPLDGGHVAVAVYEGARHRLRRLRGYRGDVQRVDYQKLLPLTYGVAATFAVLTLFILGADIVNPVTLS